MLLKFTGFEIYKFALGKIAPRISPQNDILGIIVIATHEAISDSRDAVSELRCRRRWLKVGGRLCWRSFVGGLAFYGLRSAN